MHQRPKRCRQNINEIVISDIHRNESNAGALRHMLSERERLRDTTRAMRSGRNGFMRAKLIGINSADHIKRFKEKAEDQFKSALNQQHKQNTETHFAQRAQNNVRIVAFSVSGCFCLHRCCTCLKLCLCIHKACSLREWYCTSPGLHRCNTHSISAKRFVWFSFCLNASALRCSCYWSMIMSSISIFKLKFHIRFESSGLHSAYI